MLNQDNISKIFYKLTQDSMILNKFGVYSIMEKKFNKNNLFEILFLLDFCLFILKGTKRCFSFSHAKNQKLFVKFILGNKHHLNLNLFKDFSIKYKLLIDIFLNKSRFHLPHYCKDSVTIVASGISIFEISNFLNANKYNMYMYFKKINILLKYSEHFLILLSLLIKQKYKLNFVKFYLYDVLVLLDSLNIKRLLGFFFLVEQLQLNFYYIMHKVNFRVNYGFFPEVQFFLRDVMKGYSENSFNSYARQFWLSRLNKGLIFRLQRHYPFGDSISPTVDFAHKAEGSIMTIERWLELFFGAIVEDQEEEETLEGFEVDGVLDSIITGFSFDQVREVKVRVLLNIAALRFQRRFYLKRKRNVLNKLTTHKGRFIGEIGRTFREKINLADLFYGAPQGILLGNGILERIEPVDKIRLTGRATLLREKVDSEKDKDIFITLQRIRFYSYYWYKNPYFFSFLIKDLKNFASLGRGEQFHMIYFSGEDERRFARECYLMDIDLMMQINNIVKVQQFYEIPSMSINIVNRIYRTVKSISETKASLLNLKFDSTTMFNLFISLSNLYEQEVFKFFSNYVWSVSSRNKKQVIIDYYNSSDIGSFFYHTKLFKEILNFLWYKRYNEFIVNLWVHEFSDLFAKLDFAQESLISAFGHNKKFLDFSSKLTVFDSHFSYNVEAEAYPPWKPRIKNKRIINPKPRYNWFKFKPMVGVWLPLILNPFFQNKFEETRRWLYDSKSILRVNYLDHLTNKEKKNIGNYYSVLKDSYLKAGVPKKTFEDLIIKYPQMSYLEFMLEKFWVFNKGIDFSSLFGFAVFHLAKTKMNASIMLYVTFIKQYMYYKRARVLIDTRKYILLNQFLNFMQSKVREVINASNFVNFSFIEFLKFLFIIPLIVLGNLYFYLFVKGFAFFFIIIFFLKKKCGKIFRNNHIQKIKIIKKNGIEGGSMLEKSVNNKEAKVK